MLFNSLDFLIFFPAVTLVNFLIPKKIRYIWLLAASYYFYMCYNAKHVILLFFSTVVTYLCGLLLEKAGQKAQAGKKLGRKGILSVCVLLNLGLLLYFKYADFALDTLRKVFRIFHVELNVPAFDIILPIGISFFIFQALGYAIDVYRGNIKAERNFLRYALFVSFFPQLVAGPIERSENLLNQLKECPGFNVRRVESGLLKMAYGLLLKIVLADNIARIVDPPFLHPEQYGGMDLLLAVALFGIQIYCDFEGYTKIAVGSAEVLGYYLRENFNSPYLAVSVKDFWKRWHISLTSWFRDYLYISLGGSRKGKCRKYINTMIVFLCSGLWHGAAWHYVVWGGLNGVLSVLEDITKPALKKLEQISRIERNHISFQIFQRFLTFFVIDLTWLFFRAHSVPEGLYMLRKIVTDFRWEWFLTADYTRVFVNVQNIVIISVSALLLLAVDILRYMGRDVKQIVFSQQIVFRWIIYWVLLMVILYWGAYGAGDGQAQFIYFQF